MVRSENAPAVTRSAVRRKPDVGIPHPSWRQTVTAADHGAGRLISAGDFWARLGI